MYVWKTVKVFLSSTFLDLEIERDRLADVFGKLKQDLTSRALALIPYDLRWRERHSNDPIAHWCLRMVRQCQYFVGILGNRYGWRPPYLEDNQPNIQHISVTEMEIREAQHRIPKEQRFFCFSQVLVSTSSESPEDIVSIQNLRESLLAEKESIFTFSNQAELREIVERELKKRIFSQYPIEQKTSFLEYDLLSALNTIIHEKSRGFIGRQKYLQKIHDFCKASTYPNYLGIHAVAGTGKSSLLAYFIQEWQKKMPDIPIIAHFMGMTSTSRHIAVVLESLAKQLVDAGIMAEPLPQDIGTLRNVIQDALEHHTAPLIIAIDGLDELEPQGQNLIWLPRQLPVNVRLVLTTRPVDPWPLLRTYPRLKDMELCPLEDNEIISIIQHNIQERVLQITDMDITLLQKRAGGNPLYLKVALEEIEEGGIAVGQLANSIEALFEQILQRLGASYGHDLVWDYLGLLGASRYGLTESEIVEILQDQMYPTIKNDVDDNLVAIVCSLDNFLIQRGGLIVYFHAEFERAILQRLGVSKMRQYHKQLARYFKNKGYEYARTLLELPYQQQWAVQPIDVLATLSDWSFIEKKCLSGMIHNLLEDFLRVNNDPVVSVPDGIVYRLTSDIHVYRQTAQYLAKALQLDLDFIRQHPDEIFQCLWNRCYWHDIGESPTYYVNKVNPITICPEYQLSRLIQYWEKQQKQTSVYWKSLRPLNPHLHSPVLKILTGHTSHITSVAWDLDGARLVSACMDGMVRVWDVHTGETILRLIGHEGGVRSAIFGHDGQLIFSGGNDGLILVWDAQTGASLEIWEGHQDAVTGLTLSEDKKYIFSCSQDGSIGIWNIITGERIASLSSDSTSLLAIATAKDYIAVAGNDTSIRIWKNKTLYKQWIAHERAVQSLAFDTTGTILASVGNDGYVKLWDVKTQKNISSYMHNGNVSSICYMPSTQSWISGGQNNTVKLWQSHVHTLEQSKWHVTCLALYEHKQHLAVGAEDGSISIWSLDGIRDNYILEGPKATVTSFLVSQDWAITGSEDGQVYIWDMQITRVWKTLPAQETPIQSLAITPDNKKIAFGTEEGKISIYNPNTNALITQIDAHHGRVMGLVFLNENKLASIGYFDKYIKLWQVNNGACLGKVTGHERWVQAIALNADHRMLATASRDTTLRLWNLDTCICHKVLRGHDTSVTCVAFSHDQKRLVSGSYGGPLHIWDIESGACHMILHGHKDLVNSVAFSEDDLYIISSSRDAQTLLWDSQSGEILHKLNGEVIAQELSHTQTPYFALVQAWQTMILHKKDYLTSEPNIQEKAIGYIQFPLLPNTFYTPNRLLAINKVASQELHHWGI